MAKKQEFIEAGFSLDGIIPLTNIPADELESEKLKIFYKAYDMLSEEGYVLGNDFIATPKDSNTYAFKAKWAKNGFRERSILNFEGWMVRFKYQRYRRRQKCRIKGEERPTKFSTILPPRSLTKEDTQFTVVQLFQGGWTVRQILDELLYNYGITLKEITVRKWLTPNNIAKIVERNNRKYRNVG